MFLWRLCSKVCRDAPVDGTKHVSLDQWESFVQSKIWQSILFELEGREEFLTSLLVRGKDEWSDDALRAKIHELEFFRTLPSLLIDQIQLDWKTLQREKELEDARD